MPTVQELFAQCDAPVDSFDNSMLGPEFPAELDLVSRLWFRCGYRPGIGAYLNFFLLRELHHDARHELPAALQDVQVDGDVLLHDGSLHPRRDRFGRPPTGGISSPKVRDMLRQIQKRHQNVKIPPWMQTYFGSACWRTWRSSARR
jgi:hypothetical protein